MISPTDLTAADAVARIRARELGAQELFDAYLERAARDELNAFTWVAERAPGDLPGPGTPLAGVPVAVKDLFCTIGVPSQAGSKILEGYRPPYTATVVAKLMDAGATLLGKTNQDEFAMGSSNENSAFGPVLNPWDRRRVPGGSSGGSAAAVAAGTAPWAIGTDTGGSIRQPAALCGIVGLKPTYGACSRYGMIAFASSLDQAGPLTRDVTDAALLLSHMVGHDPRDSTSIAMPEPIVMPTAEDLRGIRLGVPEELLGGADDGAGIEPGVRASFEAALSVAEGLGATVDTCRLPHAPHALSAYYLIAPAEASANLARFDGVRYGLRVAGDADLDTMYGCTRAQGFGPEVKRRIMLGTYALSSGYYDAYYGTALKVRTKIAEDFRAVFSRFDFVVTPTSPWTAFELGSKTADPLAMYLNDFCTVPMPLAGIPAISIPSGLSEGLPVGFQLAGPAFSENRMLDAAYALERAIGFDGTHPAPTTIGMSVYEPVIGLEIHVQLKTRTKMFCGCELSFGDPPNVHVCPVCLGLPGALPVVNARAVEFAIRIGLALGSEIAPRSLFHRKNYFYPDSPKGYQISQYDVPICSGGELGGVRIHRAHLEEDAAKLVHMSSSGRIHGSDRSVVDYNRCGTPLVEIVTEPDLRSAEQAHEFLTLLRVTLRQLGVSDVNMDEGSLRCDANVSIRPAGSDTFGTKTELKNMNSFRFLERGVRSEIERQVALLQDGEAVSQETLHYEPVSGRLTSLRSKEEAHDYRYFPEPDLVPVVVDEPMLQAARTEVPELPAVRAQRFEQDLGINPGRARDLAFRKELADYFEAALAVDGEAGAVELSNWIPQLVERIGSSEDPAVSRVRPEALASLVRMVTGRQVSRDAARDVLTMLVAEGGDPRAIVEREGLQALSGADEGDEIMAAVDRVLGADPDAAAKVREGNAKAIGALVGPVMRELKGRADGAEVRRLILERIAAS